MVMERNSHKKKIGGHLRYFDDARYDVFVEDFTKDNTYVKD